MKNNTKKINSPVKKNPHYDAIMAFANGDIVEWLNPMSGKYEECKNPMFYLDAKYRVKDMSMQPLLESIRKVENIYIKNKHIDNLITEAKKADVELDLFHHFLSWAMNRDSYLYTKGMKLLDEIQLKTERIK